MDDHEILPAVAERIRESFEELGGRALAVTEALITKTNIPTLPLCMVAPLRQTFEHNLGGRAAVQEQFTVEFWLEPARIKGEKGETPFWSYYDYNTFRDRLFTLFAGWVTPGGGQVRFMAFEVEATELAVILAFTMRAEYQWCPNVVPNDPPDGEPGTIVLRICAPRSVACGEFEPIEPCDNCPKCEFDETTGEKLP